VTPRELARAEERAVEGDVDHGAPRVRRHVLGRYGEVRRRVVDQHLRQPVGRLGGVERGRDLLGIADVAADGRDRRAQRCHRLVPGFEVLGLAAGDHDRRAEPGELQRDGLAQAGAGAGDEHRGTVERAGRQRVLAQRGRVGEARQIGGHGLSSR
jgi:hypothetical protein